MKQLKEIDRKLAGGLLEAVERREFRVTYKEVSERVSPRLGHTVNPHYELVYPLGAVSSLCHKLGLPLISTMVMVRYSDAKSANAVGAGFYPLACDLNSSTRIALRLSFESGTGSHSQMSGVGSFKRLS